MANHSSAFKRHLIVAPLMLTGPNIPAAVDIREPHSGAVPITFSAGVIRLREYLSVAEAVQLADELRYPIKQHGKRNIAYYQGQEIRLIRDTGTNPVT